MTQFGQVQKFCVKMIKVKSLFGGKSMKKGLVAARALAVATATILFFQNCSQNVPEATSFSSEAYVDPKLAGLPFPYEYTVNHLAYMSCPMSNASVDQKGYFVIRAGAYDDSVVSSLKDVGYSSAGMQFREKFKTSWNNSKKLFADELQEGKLKETLLGLPSVVGVTPIVGMFRLQGNVSRIDRDNTPVTKTFLTNLDSDPIADYFARRSSLEQRKSYFSKVGELSKRSIGFDLNTKVGSIAYDFDSNSLVPRTRTDDEGEFRQYLRQEGISLLFAAQENQDDLRLTDSDGTNIGRQLRFEFEPALNNYSLQGALTGDAIYPDRVLMSVSETNLSTMQAAEDGTWDCGLKVLIVRPDDRWSTQTAVNQRYVVKPELGDQFVVDPSSAAFTAPTIANALLCPTDNQPTDAEKERQYHLIRRFLPAEEWDVSVIKNNLTGTYSACAVDRRNKCYDPRLQVNYSSRICSAADVAQLQLWRAQFEGLRARDSGNVISSKMPKTSDGQLDVDQLRLWCDLDGCPYSFYPKTSNNTPSATPEQGSFANIGGVRLPNCSHFVPSRHELPHYVTICSKKEY